MTQDQQNQAAFEAALPRLRQASPSAFVLMHNGVIVGFFDNRREARLTGVAIYRGDDEFSIQQVAGGG